jgi:carbamoyl-phosphate synthase large subunit
MALVMAEAMGLPLACMTDSPKILVTSAGTGSAISVIQALKGRDGFPVGIWACDTDPSAPGLFLADHGCIAPSLSDGQKYLGFLLNLSKTIGPYCLIPTLSREISLISSWSQELARSGITTLLPSPRTVQTCDDKLAFGAFCVQNEIPSPRIFTGGQVTFPAFVKPRIGSGSRGSGIARNPEELQVLSAQAKDALVQEYLDGPEITVDVLCRAGGEVLVASARRRVSVKNGQSVKGTTIAAAPYRPLIEKACRRLEIAGPCNFQFIECADGPRLIEINPRFAAGGLALSVHAGANIPLLMVKLMLGMTIAPAECEPRLGVHMTKYWSEVFWESPT